MKPGDELSVYNEKEKKWLSDFTVVEKDGKQVSIKTGDRVVKVNISRLIPSIKIDYKEDIITILNFLWPFSTIESPEIMLTEFLSDKDPRALRTTL